MSDPSHAAASRVPEGLQELLVLEDHPLFAEVVCPSTGILVWPAIRQDVIRTLLSARLYSTRGLTDQTLAPRHVRVVSAAASAWHSVVQPPRRSTVLIVATGAGLTPLGGKWRNRYADPFAEILPGQTWTVERAWPGWQIMRTRVNPRVGSSAGEAAATALAARFLVRSRHRVLAAELVHLAGDLARDRLGVDLAPERRERLTSIAARRIASYPVRAELARRLLRRVRPKLALVEEGCYGHMAVFNVVARDLGVTVAEFQHGLVTRGHDAYNVAPALADSAAYRQTQPHAFLAYGRWWTQQFNAPVDDKVVVGNPYRSERMATWQSKPVRDVVLVLGDGVETEAHIALCRTLMRRLPAPVRVRFRPHPLEIVRIAGTLARDIEVDREPDLYGSLASAQAVVAEASTALFESAGLVPRVFAWDTDKSRFYLGEHPFETFRTDEELAKALGSEPNVGRQIAESELWVEGWADRARTYVMGVLDGAPREPSVSGSS